MIEKKFLIECQCTFLFDKMKKFSAFWETCLKKPGGIIHDIIFNAYQNISLYYDSFTMPQLEEFM